MADVDDTGGTAAGTWAWGGVGRKDGADGRCCRCRYRADEADAGVKFIIIIINVSL